MPFVADHPMQYLHEVVGDGHCVALVQEAAGAPVTTHWRCGAKVTDDVPRGTAIATFDPNGRYGNHVDGRSHAAILLAVNTDGLRVLDQWVGQPAHQRTIAFRNGSGDAVNDGDQFHVVEVEG